MTSAAIVVPAPGRFSTITCWPRVFVISAAVTRAKVSVAPPGANATTRRTGLAGKAWATASAAANAVSVTIRAKGARFIDSSSFAEMLPEKIHRQPERPVRFGLAPGPAAVAREGVVGAGIL